MATSEARAKRRLGTREKREIGKTVAKLLLIVLLMYGAFGYALGIAVVEGEGMRPGAERGGVVVFNRRGARLTRGDMVIIEQDGRQMLQRVIAVGGDVIEIGYGSKVLVNGQEEDTLGAVGETKPRGASAGVGRMRVEDGTLYVLGDNRERAYDSRDFGAIDEGSVIGKVVLKLERY